MDSRFAYDLTQDPPAPVLPVRIAAPGSDDAVLLAALVDSGAECTLIPVMIVRRLGLPMVDWIEIAGVGGPTRVATVHAAALEIGGRALLARVVAFQNEALIGRDLLNRLVVLLDGPQLVGSLSRRTRKSTRRTGR